MRQTFVLTVWLGGFLLLNLYAHLVPRWVGFAIPAWLTYAVGFFVLAFVVCRYELGVREMADVGLGRPPGWWRYLAVGFFIGFGIWALKNVMFVAMGKFELVGWRDLGFALPLLGQAMFGMFVASAINDLLIRGYGLAFCRRFHLMALYVLLTSVVYALDDSWNEGINLNNVVFSLVLGISLAYTVVKTGAIWMSIGIHWGGNVCFRIMSGFDGNGIARVEHVIEGVRFEYASVVITALLFPVILLVLRLMQERPGQSANQKEYANMKRVTGIGGVFIKAKDPATLREWYKTHLGIDVQAWGGTAFRWTDEEGNPTTGTTVWSVSDGDNFAPSSASFMVNYRVANLHALLAALKAEGCNVLDKVEESEFGKFGWVMDPEGNKIELWEPPPGQ